MATEPLIIEVKYKDNGAGQSLKHLRDHIIAIDSASRSQGFSNLKNVAESMKTLGDSAQSVTGITKSFQAVSQSAKNLFSTFKSFNPASYAGSIKSLSSALSVVGDALEQFSKKGAGIASVGQAMGSIAKGINTFANSDAANNINNVSDTLGKLASASDSVAQKGAGLNAFRLGLQKLPEALAKYDSATTSRMTNLQDGGLVGNFGSVIKGLSDTLSGINAKAFNAVGTLADGIAKLSKMANDPNLSQNLQNIAKTIAEFAQNVVNNISPDVLSRFERLGAAMAGLSSGSGNNFNVSGMAGSASYASKIFSDLGNNIMRVVKLGWQLGKLPFKMILSPLQKIGQGIMGMTNRFTTFLKGIGRIALYRAIRTGIKLVTQSVREGVNNLYIWAGMVGNSFKPTMDSLATSFLYLKNSIGAAVSPLLDALAPALETVVNQIVDVLNIFNQVIATMTGATTWRKALRAPASYADNISGLGHDAEDANDAVKELKRTILGFDEINKLEDKTKTLTPKQNGKDATGYYAKQGAFSFTEVPISQTALDIASKLKEAWEKGDFTSIGNMIGEKVGTALLRVPWEKEIQPTVKKLASSFGTLLSGMFDYNGTGGKKMWDGIAYTVYNALNTAILGYVTFFDSVKWEGIGEGIGAALKKVCKNIKWDWMAEALTKFPNAIIDALTGFTKQFTVQDFFELGQNIGNTVSKAISEIKWADLFKNTFKIATGIVAAFNGALTSFDWASVKGAILGGIKRVPAKSWSDLGTQIGQAIFNVAVFVANLVDTLVRFIKLGNWGALFDGIKTGITNGLKQYGGWTGVAKKLGEWIPENIGTISIILALAVGLPLLKALPSAFATTVMNALNLKKVPGTGMTLGAWLKAVTLAAGVIVAVHGISTILGHDFKKSSVGDNVLTLLKGAGELGAAGAGIGFTFGGPPGALIGALTGAAISLGIGLIDWACDEGVFADIDRKLFKAFGDFSIGAVKFLKDAGKFVVDVSLDLEIEKILPKIGKNAIQLAKDTWEGSMFQGIVNQIFGTGGSTVSADDYEDSVHAWDKVDDDTLAAAFPIDGPKTASVVAENNHRVGAADKTGVPVPLAPTVSQQAAQAAWKQLSTWWDQIIKKNTVAEFMTKGIVNNAVDWWKSTQGFWENAINGKTASKFNIAGIVDKASTWWSNVQQYWSRGISGKTASRFTIAGIWDRATTWWSEVKGYWSNAISGNTASRFTVEGIWDRASTWWSEVKGYWSRKISNDTASKFSIAGIFDDAYQWWTDVQYYWSSEIAYKTADAFEIDGVVDDSWSWWSDVQYYWGNVVNGDSLGVDVTVNDTWNAFVDAWNDLSDYFSKNPVTAYVKTVTQTTTTAAKAYQGKANGGVYKNGQWHDVTAFAAGGFPSGEIFVAREAGPELVGTIGGNTAVVNNDQIVASVSAGVAQAVASVLGGGSTNEITINVDSETLYRAVRKGERMASGRYGTSVAIG